MSRRKKINFANPTATDTPKEFLAEPPEPFHQVHNELKTRANFDSARRKLETAARFLAQIATHRKGDEATVTFDKNALTSLRNQIDNIRGIITMIKEFTEIEFPTMMATTRSLAALEATSYRGRIGTNQISGFQFNSMWEEIYDLYSQRPKATPLMPSADTLEAKAELAVKLEHELIKKEMDIVHASLSVADQVASAQRATFEVYQRFVNQRIAQQRCQQPEELREALNKMLIVQQYYLTFGPLTRTPSETAYLPQDGLGTLPTIVAPSATIGLH